MSDVLDHTWDNWCWLCQEPHCPCEVNEFGQDVGGMVDDRADLKRQAGGS